MSFKTMDEIIQKIEEMGISASQLSSGIINNNTFAQWKKRGLPSSIIKYKKILDRLEAFEAKHKLAQDWAASNKHE